MAIKTRTTDPALAAFTAADPVTAKRLQPPGQPKVTVPPPAPAPTPAAPPATRPFDPSSNPGKTAVTLRIDNDVLNTFKKTGPGWQTRINNVLRVAVFPLA